MLNNAVSAQLFESARLLASDYDGTQFHTFEPAPEGIGVNEAYELAIGQVLGSRALGAYKMQGGHNNRTPTEIVDSLLLYSDGHLLEAVIDMKGEGASNDDVLEFISDRPDPEFTQGWLPPPEEHLRIITDLVVDSKLRPLLRQIGQKIDDGVYWPRPVEGFIDLVKTVGLAKANGQVINTAVISAGHARFIEKTYELYEVPMPDVMVTDETIQAHNAHISAERRAKPAPYPMVLAKRQWMDLHHQSAVNLRDPDASAAINTRIVYVGDDAIRDGGLARSSHVEFVLIDSKNPLDSWWEAGRRLQLGNAMLKGVVE